VKIKLNNVDGKILSGVEDGYYSVQREINLDNFLIELNNSNFSQVIGTMMYTGKVNFNANTMSIKLNNSEITSSLYALGYLHNFLTIHLTPLFQ
ncbi:MAG: hypothetical protein ACK5LC_01465, partial [Coprobacillaceae bacterium]